MLRAVLEGEAMLLRGLSTTVAAMVWLSAVVWLSTIADAQLTDITQTPNRANAGIQKSLEEQIGAGQGDVMTPDASLFIIQRDPFRAIRRGRQMFQRKFTAAQGAGPRVDDGVGDIETTTALGAGLADSCAGCHGRPRGSAGAGGSVFTRPESRDAPHLFGVGLKEMLADEITTDLRAIRAQALNQARRQGRPVTSPLRSKGIDYGTLTAHPDGRVDPSKVDGVDPDLRVRPFLAHGATISLREFIVGAFDGEMGLQAQDLELTGGLGRGTHGDAGGHGARRRARPNRTPAGADGLAEWHGARAPHKPGRSSGVLPPQLL
jgi:hypothetical protein